MVDRAKDDIAACIRGNVDKPGCGFGQFYKCPKFSDVCLLDSSGHRIAAHRLVLSAGSRKFNDLLSRENSSEIPCVDIDPECLHAMLEYFYTSRCNIQVDNAVQLLSAALNYGCDELESMVSLYIHMHINATTCCFFFAEAQRYKVEHIAIKALYVASLDFPAVIESRSFFDLSLENLTALLGSPKLGSVRKLALYKAGCAWIMKDAARLEKFKDVLMCIQTRPTTCSDQLQLMRLFNGSEFHPDDLGEETEWTATGATAATASGLPFLSRGSGDQASQMIEAIGSRQFLKELKSDEVDQSTDASRMTAAINVALYSDELQKGDVKRMEAADSVKTRPMEDNASSEASITRKPKSRRGRARKGAGKTGQPFTCQVDGCINSLHGLKEYHIRYKICHHHLKVDSIVKDGQPQRFCQQCGRFHLLEEFDNNKRSCRTRLLRHNLRRRKRQHPKGGKPNTILPSVGFPSQHPLVYLSREDNLEKLYEGRSRCLQILSPTEMNPCLMLSPVPQNVERDPQKHERAQHEAEMNSAIHRLSYVKPDPGTGTSGEKRL